MEDGDEAEAKEGEAGVGKEQVRSDDEPKDGEEEGAPLPGTRRGTSGRKGDRGADGIGRQPRAAVEGKASSTRALLLSLPASGGARRRTKGESWGSGCWVRVMRVF